MPVSESDYKFSGQVRHRGQWEKDAWGKNGRANLRLSEPRRLIAQVAWMTPALLP